MSTSRNINNNEVYIICNDKDNANDVRTLFCFIPGSGTSYTLDKMALGRTVQVAAGTPPTMVYENNISYNASFQTTTHTLDLTKSITTSGGVVSGTNMAGTAVSFKVDMILWMTHDAGGGSIAYGVANIEE